MIVYPKWNYDTKSALIAPFIPNDAQKAERKRAHKQSNAYASGTLRERGL